MSLNHPPAYRLGGQPARARVDPCRLHTVGKRQHYHSVTHLNLSSLSKLVTLKYGKTYARPLTLSTPSVQKTGGTFSLVLLVLRHLRKLLGKLLTKISLRWTSHVARRSFRLLISYRGPAFYGIHQQSECWPVVSARKLQAVYGAYLWVSRLNMRLLIENGERKLIREMMTQN
jgi:hypothetical protein